MLLMTPLVCVFFLVATVAADPVLEKLKAREISELPHALEKERAFAFLERSKRGDREDISEDQETIRENAEERRENLEEKKKKPIFSRNWSWSGRK